MESTSEPLCKLSQEQLERYHCIGNGAICQAILRNGEICGYPVGSHRREELNTHRQPKEEKIIEAEAIRCAEDAVRSDLPIGIVLAFPSTRIPSDYLLLDGSVVQRSHFPQLFELLWPTSPQMSNRLPDLRGRVIIATDDTFPLGSSGGSSTIVLTEAQLPPHTHQGFVGLDGHKCHSAPVNCSVNQHPHGTGPIGITGRGEPISILPPYFSLYYIIKAK